MRKYAKLASVVGGLSLVLGLAACAAPEGEASQGEAVTLHVVSFGLGGIEDPFAEFTEETGINVEVEDAASDTYPALLQSRIGGKADVDLVQTRSGAEFNKYAKAGSFTDISGDPLLENLSEGAVQAGLVDGKNYGFAEGQFATGVYYNTELFEDLGIAVPEDWDEFMAAAETIRESGTGVAPIVISAKDGWTNQYYYHNALAAYSAENPTFMADLKTGDATWTDAPAFEKQIERYRDLASEGAFIEGGSSIGYGDAQAAFGAGKAAMWVMGSWGLGGLVVSGFTPGAFALPINDAGEPAAPASSLSDTMISVTSWSEKQDAARQLLSYMATPEFGAKYQVGQSAKSTVLGVQDAEYSPFQADWDAMFETAVPYPFDIGPSVNGDGPGLLSGLLDGSSTVADVLAGFQELQDADNAAGY